MNRRETEITNIGVVTHSYTNQEPEVFVQLEWDPCQTFKALILEDPKYEILRIARENNAGVKYLTDLKIDNPWVLYRLDKMFVNNN